MRVRKNVVSLPLIFGTFWMSAKRYRSRIVLKCENMEQAQIMQQVLAVDEELQPHKLVLTYSTNAGQITGEGPQLIMYRALK